MSITIRDVAKAAGVSVATVSRVLNKKPNVSNSALRAVNRAVEEMGYSPNFLGRDLRKSETKRILAIMTSLKHNFYSEVIEGMESAAAEKGYDVLVAATHSDPEREMHLLSMLFSRSVDGAVLLDSKLDSETITKLGQNHSLALCIERVDNAKVLTVTIDNEKAAYDVVSVLIGKGRRKIGMISTETRLQSSVDRENGYRRALREAGIPIKEEYIYYGNFDYETGVKGCNYLCDLREPPDAIFSVSDLLGIGAMNTVISRGLIIGRDVAFFGFDNIDYSRIFKPHLSTVEQPRYLQGRVVVEKLIENMKAHERDLGTYMLPHRLILRESTGD